MPNRNSRVAIEIYVDDQGSVKMREFAATTDQGLDEVETKSATVTSSMREGWRKVKESWVGITAAIIAMRGAWDAANLAAQARQERVSFEHLAASYGANADFMIDKLKDASGQTISTMSLVRDAGTAMMMGINPEKISHLMRIARGTARMTGQTVRKAFGDLSLAIGRQSKMILDNLGIIVSVGKANTEYAASLGKTASQLTAAEQKQAFLNASLKAGDDLLARMGDQADTGSDKLQRLSATTENLKVLIGGGLVRVYEGLLGTMYTVESGIMSLVRATMKVGQGLGWVTDHLHLTAGAADEFKTAAEGAKAAGVDFAGKASHNFADMVSKSKAAAAAQGRLNKTIDATTAAVSAQGKAQSKLADQQHKLVSQARAAAKERADAITKMYKEAGIGADQYYHQEASRMVQKAAAWEKAGGDQLAIEKWLYDNLGKLAEQAWNRGEEASAVYMDSVRAQSRTLVDEFNELQQTAAQKLNQISNQAAAVDGTNIGLTVSFDGEAAMVGLDRLLAKLQKLKQATSTSSPSHTNGGGRDADSYNPNASFGGPVAYDDWNAQTGTQATYSTVNINQSLSRSDVAAILAEERRRGARD